LVGYHFDANHIRGIPIKNRKGSTILEAWKELQSTFEQAGIAPKTYVLDNETSGELLDAFKEQGVDYQLVPPYKHRNNLAERAIQTFKKHLKAALAGADPNFPLSEWDRLISQANITLNLLRSSRTNPRLSAHAYIFGEFNFNATPLAPPGTKIVAFISPEKRATWELNGEVGWYVGPSMHHYRCVQCYFPRPRDVRDCDTVEFFPHSIPFPEVKLKDHLKQAATDIVTLLTQPPSFTVPSLQERDPTRNALLTSAQILNTSDIIPETMSTPDNTTNAVSPPRVSRILSKVPLPRMPPDASLQQHMSILQH